MRGIALMVVSTLAFSSMHATIKHVSGEVDTFMIVFFRNLFGFVALMPLFIRHGLAPLRTQRLGTHALRVTINFASMAMFFYALSITPLAEVAALTFSAPIFATFLAIFFFKETVGVTRWAAIFLGFLGTVVILRPGFEQVSLGAVLALSAAMTWGTAIMIIKSLGKTDSALTITAYMVLLLIPISLVPALFVWEWPTWGVTGALPCDPVTIVHENGLTSTSWCSWYGIITVASTFVLIFISLLIFVSLVLACVRVRICRSCCYENTKT